MKPRPAAASQYVVEAAQTGDIRTVMRLAWKTTQHLYPALFFEEIAAHQNEYFRVVRDTATGRVAGFVIAARQPGRQQNFLLLAVEPSLVGQGLRRALLQDVQRVVRQEGVRHFSVEVPLTDRVQLAFYRRQGYAIVGIENASGAAFEDKALMAKLL